MENHYIGKYTYAVFIFAIYYATFEDCGTVADNGLESYTVHYIPSRFIFRSSGHFNHNVKKFNHLVWHNNQCYKKVVLDSFHFDGCIELNDRPSKL